MSVESMSIHKRYSDLQAAIGAIGMDGKNKHFGNKYATLPAILKEIEQPLATFGFVIMPSFGVDGITTKLLDIETGEAVETAILPWPDTKDPQKLGSAITYGRRYGISAVLNLRIDEDDDGNAAAGNGYRSRTAPSQSTQTHPATKGGTGPSIPMGKHKGTLLSDLVKSDRGYVDWLIKTWVPKKERDTQYPLKEGTNDYDLYQGLCAIRDGIHQEPEQSNMAYSPDPGDGVPF